MNLAVIGSGGREHAICYKLKQSRKVKKLICIPVYEDDSRTMIPIVQNFLRKNDIKISQEIKNMLIERSKGDRKNLNNELSRSEEFLTYSECAPNDSAILSYLVGNKSVQTGLP